MLEIDKKIVKVDPIKSEHVVFDVLNESIKRPDYLKGTTYRLKTPLADATIYITINDIILNEGTENEKIQPFELFINSKSMQSFAWVVGMTRLISAIFRKGGDVTFIVDELKSIFDPNGGYLAKGGKYIPSLLAEIGSVIEKHFINIGLIKGEIVDTRRLDDDKEMVSSRNKGITGLKCPACQAPTLIMKEGCKGCTSCGYEACG